MNINFKVILCMVVASFLGMIAIGIKVFGIGPFAVGLLVFLFIWFIIFSFVDINY